MIKMYTVIVLTILTLSSVTGNSLIQPKLNPGCPRCRSNETVLVYVKAQGDEFDYVIHQLWDFTGHVPTMLYIIGNENSTLDIEWDKNKPKEIKTNNTYHSFAVIFNDLLEYNDTDADKVYFDYKFPHREISLRDVTWRLEESVLSNNKTKVRVRGALSWKRHGLNGTISMKLVLVPSVGRSPSLPRLYHSVNTTQVDVALAGLTVSPRYSAGRFALRYIVVSEDSADDSLRFSAERSIDDEYTPGVFETNNVMTPAGATGLGGFVQYRPVAYTMSVRGVEDSVTAYLRFHNKTKIPRDCLAEKYYSQFDDEDVLVEELVASFGESGDGYYNKTKYAVWTYSVGYGTPPAESASVFIITLLTLGISTPLVAIILSVVAGFRMMRRSRQRNQASLLEEEA